MIITFFTVLFAAGSFSTAKYQRLEEIKNIRSSDLDWIYEMCQLQKAIDEYSPNEDSKMNLGVLMLIYSTDEFRDLIMSLKDTEFMIPLKGLFNYDDKTSYLFEMDKILKQDKIGIKPNMNAFLNIIDTEIYNASKLSMKNLKFLVIMRGEKSGTRSSEHKSFGDLFISTIYRDGKILKFMGVYSLNRAFISKMNSKGNFKHQKNTEIYIHPKYLFLQNYDNKEYIEQKELENIKSIFYYGQKYNIVAIFLKNCENNHCAVVMQRNKEWIAFVGGECEHFDADFTLPWHVTLVMYEKK